MNLCVFIQMFRNTFFNITMDQLDKDKQKNSSSDHSYGYVTVHKHEYQQLFNAKRRILFDRKYNLSYSMDTLKLLNLPENKELKAYYEKVTYEIELSNKQLQNDENLKVI